MAGINQAIGATTPAPLIDPAVLTAPPSPETGEFNDRLARVMAELPDPWRADLEELRAWRAAGKGVIPVEGPRDEATWVEGVDGRRLRHVSARRVAGRAPRGVYLHIHGGGWTFGAPEQFDGRNLEIALGVGVDVLSVAYRLSPEHRWPASHQDALAGARMAARLAAEAGGIPVIVGGESAGAHLSATLWAAAGALEDSGGPALFGGFVFNYGIFDLRMTPSMRNWGADKLILSTPIVHWFIGNLLGDNVMLAQSPEASPLLADLGGAPPALFQIGTADPLLDDSLFMAARWSAAGGRADLAVWPGGAHAFDSFIREDDRLPIAHAARALERDWIDRRLTELGC